MDLTDERLILVCVYVFKYGIAKHIKNYEKNLTVHVALELQNFTVFEAM